MPRPQVIRADTLDLQSREASSAQDHIGTQLQGELGPSQSTAIRNAAKEQAQAQDSLTDAMNGAIIDDSLIHDTNGINTTEEDDLTESTEAEDGFEDKMSSSPSIDDEDIDFDFVYALHTFVATVEGQANASKGDTMVLLDDSNSYWWLVRIVKDSSIGYLPAEHIETPSERLARLNKHRNVDLSSTMLQDVPDKPMNPLKKAIRRRNAKAVSFAAPIFYEPSEYDYSDAEEEGENGDGLNGVEAPRQQDDEITEVKPTETVAVRSAQRIEPAGGLKTVVIEPEEKPRKTSATPADVESLLNGDMEPKKISFPLKLLSEEGNSDISSSHVSLSINTGSVRRREDLVISPPLGKGDKKGKKGGVLGGLFKKRLKHKNKEVEVEDLIGHSDKSDKRLAESTRERQKLSEIENRAVEPRKLEPRKEASKPQVSPEPRKEQINISSIRRVGPDSPAKNRNYSTPSNSQEKPLVENAIKKADVQEIRLSYECPSKVSSESERSIEKSPTEIVADDAADLSGQLAERDATHVEDAQPEIEQTLVENNRLSESPEHITHEDAIEQPPALVADTSSEEIALNISPIESSETLDSKLASSTAMQQISAVWSDSSLKSYFDDDHDIRDFLVVVQKDSIESPQKASHPAIQPLFQNHVSKLQNLNSRLDSILDTWLERKGRR